MKFHRQFVQRIAASERLYYGWVVLVICFLSFFFSAPGQTYFTSVFIEEYIRDFGWSRSEISSLYSLATLISGLLLFGVGRLSDRYGHKNILVIAGLILGASCLWTSQISMLWMIMISFFLGRITGQGTMTMLPTIIVPQWFYRRRALALSLMALGGATGSAIIPPLNAWLINSVGWRVTWRIWALLLWLIFVPVVGLLLRNYPEDIGLTLADEQTKKLFQTKKLNGTEDLKVPPLKFAHVPSWQARDAVKTISFWILVYVQLLMPMIGTGLTFHFFSLMATHGVAENQAPVLLSTIALVTVLSTLLAGAVIKPQAVRLISPLIAGTMALALFVMMFTRTIMMAFVFVILLGLMNGFISVWSGLIWPEYFGTQHLGSIRGLVTALMVISSAVGPIPFGIVYDQTGNYQNALLLFFIISVAGTIVALFCPKPKNPPAY